MAGKASVRNIESKNSISPRNDSLLRRDKSVRFIINGKNDPKNLVSDPSMLRIPESSIEIDGSLSNLD